METQSEKEVDRGPQLGPQSHVVLPPGKWPQSPGLVSLGMNGDHVESRAQEISFPVPILQLICHEHGRVLSLI